MMTRSDGLLSHQAVSSRASTISSPASSISRPASLISCPASLISRPASSISRNASSLKNAVVKGAKALSHPFKKARQLLSPSSQHAPHKQAGSIDGNENIPALVEIDSGDDGQLGNESADSPEKQLGTSTVHVVSSSLMPSDSRKAQAHLAISRLQFF